jgi:hypothetical protein
MNRNYPKNAIAFDLVIAFLIFIACIVYAITLQPSGVDTFVGIP